MANIKMVEVSKSYHNTTILKNINLDIQDGEFIALVGPSGCGKTTTLKTLAGLVFPDQGKIFLNDKDITFLPAEKRNVVMVFQDHLLFPHLTVGENITFGLRMLGYSKEYREKKLLYLLNLVGLSGLENRYPSQLSGGQKQRVALMRALALEPEVLLLDEPLSNLDPRLRDDMRELIFNLHKDLGMTTVFVTHDQNEAMLLADRIAVIFDGKLIQYDTPYNLYNKPVSKEVANLFGMCNFIRGRIDAKGFFSFKNYSFFINKSKKAGSVEAYIRAEYIDICEPEKSVLKGVIKQIKYTGGQSLLTIELEGIVLKTIVKNHLDLKEGVVVGINIDWSRVWFEKKDDIK